MATNPNFTPALNSVPDNVGGTLQGDHYLDPKLAKFKDDPVIIAMHGANDGYRIWLDKVKGAVVADDPTMTEAKMFVENHANASRVLGECANKAANASALAKAEVGRIDAEIKERLAIREGTYSKEFRDDFKKMEPSERLSVAFAAVEAGEVDTISAILAAPPRLSGFTDEQHRVIRSRYEERLAADLIERKEAVELSLSTNERSLMDAFGAMDSIFPRAIIEDINTRTKAAKDARTF
jgi:hypothetical protein